MSFSGQNKVSTGFGEALGAYDFLQKNAYDFLQKETPTIFSKKMNACRGFYNLDRNIIQLL